MKRSAPDGFTLLEALIAGAIFFISLVGIAALATQSSYNASQSMAYSQGARLAAHEVESYAMRGYLALKPLVPTTGSSVSIPGSFSNFNGKTYSVTVDLVDTSGASGTFPDGGSVSGLGGGTAVPSILIRATSTWTKSNPTDLGVASQETYVSP